MFEDDFPFPRVGYVNSRRVIGFLRVVFPKVPQSCLVGILESEKGFFSGTHPPLEHPLVKNALILAGFSWRRPMSCQCRHSDTGAFGLLRTVVRGTEMNGTFCNSR